MMFYLTLHWEHGGGGIIMFVGSSNSGRFKPVFLIIFALSVAMGAANVASAEESDNEALTPEEQAQIEKYRAIANSFEPQYGDVAISSANATLHLGNEYYFLPADQSKRVLIEGWGNSSSAASDVLGMVFPSGKGFLDDTWAAVITYHADGYVSDEDAREADYDEMMQQAQDGEDDINRRRKLEGVEPLHFVGWALPPYYDVEHHSLIWARDIRFGDQTDDALNYDIRELGRRGVLSMNVVSEMSKLEEIKVAAAKLQNIGTFDEGSRYVDYQPGTDAEASYGVAGLVAAGLGVAAAKKLGILGVLAVFAKKFIVIIIAAFGAVVAWLKKTFGAKNLPPPSTQS